MRLRQAFVIALFWSIGATLLLAQDEPPKSDAERLAELEQQVKVLARKAELEKEQAAEKAKTAPTVSAGRDGFSFRSADGAYVLRLRGYAHFDGRRFEGDDERRAIDTFLVRRARPILEGTVFKNVDFRIMPDFGGGTTVLQDAYVDAKFTTAARLQVGKFKPPVGLERLQSATALAFVERAHPTSLVPNRDLGVQLHGDLLGARLNYALGFFNGVPDGASADVDTNDGKDVALRLFARPFAAAPLRGDLGFGVAISTGDQEGTLVGPGLPVFRTPGQLIFFNYRIDGTSAGTVIADGDRTRLVPQAYFYRGRLGLLAEHAISRQEVSRAGARRELEHEASQLQLVWVLFGGDASYRGTSVKKPFDPQGEGRGAVEIVARAHRLEMDPESFPLFANPAIAAEEITSVGLGINWSWSRNIRWLLQGERSIFEGGAAIGDREDETVVFGRLQLNF